MVFPSISILMGVILQYISLKDGCVKYYILLTARQGEFSAILDHRECFREMPFNVRNLNITGVLESALLNTGPRYSFIDINGTCSPIFSCLFLPSRRYAKISFRSFYGASLKNPVACSILFGVLNIIG